MTQRASSRARPALPIELYEYLRSPHDLIAKKHSKLKQHEILTELRRDVPDP